MISDEEKREALYREFVEIISDDMPAVFIYMPEFIYVTPNWLHKPKLNYISRQKRAHFILLKIGI